MPPRRAPPGRNGARRGDVIGAIVAPFVEAVRATFQPCTVLLVVPIVTAVVAAGARWRALASAAVAAVVGGWILIDNRWILEGWTLRLSALVVAALLVVLVVVPRERDHDGGAGPIRYRVARNRSELSVGAISLIATLWWRPCVGVELGAILNGAQNGVAGELVPMSLYMFGTLVPVAVLVAARDALEPTAGFMRATTLVSTAIGLVVAGSLVAGQHDDVVVTLTRWTLE